jgi:hypothetical protein
MIIKISVPNKMFSGERWILDRFVDFVNGEAEFEGTEAHAIFARGEGYEAEVEKPKRQPKQAK